MSINAAPSSIPDSLSQVDPSTAIESIISVYKVRDSFLSGHKRALDINKYTEKSNFKNKIMKIFRKILKFWVYQFWREEGKKRKKLLCTICSQNLTADSMKPNNLKQHLEILHNEYVNKPQQVFQI